MRYMSLYGFSLTELALVTVAVSLLALGMIPACVNAISGANMTRVGTHGRDVYIAITGANEEREALEMPSLWPSDRPPLTNISGEVVEDLNFTNSTEYFMFINDHDNLETSEWSPLVAGFDYSKLSGNGTPAYSGKGLLKAENNNWTIAKNVHDDMHDIVPVIITRNVNASSLASSTYNPSWKKKLLFDQKWNTPFRNKGAVFIRKSGSMFKARSKYMTYRVVYNWEKFDVNISAEGRSVKYPLKYITPDSQVMPEGPLATGVTLKADDYLKMVISDIKRDFNDLKRIGSWIGVVSGFVYFVILVSYVFYRKIKAGDICSLKAMIVYGLFHWATVSLFMVFFLLFGGLNGLMRNWTHLVLALLVQVTGLIFVKTKWSHKDELRKSLVKWLVAAPLLVIVIQSVLWIALFASG